MRSSEKLRFCYCEPFYIPVIASSSRPVIATFPFSVIARSEATKQSPLTLHSVIANRRVGKCAGVKQFPRCTFLLVLGVLGRLLRLIAIRLAMTVWGCRFAMTPLPVIARSQPEAISSLHLAVLFTKTLYLPDVKILSPKV